MSAHNETSSEARISEACRTLIAKNEQLERDFSNFRRTMREAETGFVETSRLARSVIGYFEGLKSALDEASAKTEHCRKVLESGNLEDMERLAEHLEKSLKDRAGKKVLLFQA